MKYSLLTEKIIKIQDEYKELLRVLKENIEKEFSPAALDEINLFWNKNIGIVRLYLIHEFAENDGYVFTASTFMDYEDNEHYPFLLLGSKHILDDPLCRYSSICNSISEDAVKEVLKEQIILAVKDNIKIIENCKRYILVLPLRIISQTSNKADFFKIGENAFLNLFDGIKTLKEYFEKCCSFSEIMHYAKPNMEKIVMFSEYDDKKLAFEQRFNQAIKDNADMVNHYENDAKAFFVMVYVCIQQAIDVIISCVEYSCTPFIRYPVALNYILLLIESLSEVKDLKSMRYKMCVANMVYKVCNKENLRVVGFNKFIDTIKSLDFNNKIFSDLEQNCIDENSFDVKKASMIIQKNLNGLYEILKK